MRKKSLLFIFIALSVALNAQVKNVIIDADTDNELDDLLAITAALKSPGLDVIGLTSVQWDGRNHTVLEGHDPNWKSNTAYTSWLVNVILMQLLDREDIPVLQGSEKKIVYERGKEDNKPRESESADFIIQEALKLPESEKLTIISTGALTNVASAIMLRPEIAKKISLYWLGQTYDFEKDLWVGEGEFNIANDLDAFDLLCDTRDLEFHIMPNNVSVLLSFHNARSITKLEGEDGVGAFIRERWRKWTKDDPNGSRIMWDVALIYAITNPEWAKEKMVYTPPGTLNRKVYIYTDINANKMKEEFWNSCFSSASRNEVKSLQNIVVYEDPRFYSTFPSIAKSDDGFIVAFRRAPNRTVFGEGYNTHIDPNSYLVMVRSKDGIHWTKEPELIYAHPFGGSQDPCLLRLRDGTLLCTSYGWAVVRHDAVANMKQPVFSESGNVALGGYILRSFDNGKTWEGPIYPPPVKGTIYHDALGNLMPAYNRGALYESESGRIFWVAALMDDNPLTKTSNHLLYSDDKGSTWHYSAVVAQSDSLVFNEASVYETPKGDLVAFIRTEATDSRPT
jgi:inosine-uridine nucleoside N-ribohydrolase